MRKESTKLHILFIGEMEIGSMITNTVFDIDREVTIQSIEAIEAYMQQGISSLDILIWSLKNDFDDKEFTKILNSFDSRPIVIVLTENINRENLLHGLVAGVNFMLRKPLDPNELKRIIHQVNIMEDAKK